MNHYLPVMILSTVRSNWFPPIFSQRGSSPKNGNYVIIYSPSSCSEPVWVSFFCWTQKHVGIQTVKYSIVFLFPYYGSQWGPLTVWLVTHIL